ncbi:DUF2188 domain-containing protein [Oxalobacteraceae bacterium OM1]|nr:DUF2188 domain-containing protein [Oxalobacteraceae bacterium OM1]
MGLDGNSAVVISPGINDRWDVSEKGSDAPLASFDRKEDAYAYADDLKRMKGNATVLVEDDDGFSPLPAPGEWDRPLDAVARGEH